MLFVQLGSSIYSSKCCFENWVLLKILTFDEVGNGLIAVTAKSDFENWVPFEV